ncbi:MAG TPA: amidohydrolase family protein [Flavitalea sp.]|nr:amidohydrolase family protein [Flavitalea sp.]
MPTIDSHIHFWKFDKNRYAWINDSMKSLQKDHLPEHVAQTFQRNGIDGCIAVQAATSEFETDFLVELSHTHPVIKGVVGWVDLAAPNAASRLEHYASNPVIKGYRHIVQSEPDDYMNGTGFRQGIAALAAYQYTYDILIYPRQLKAAIDLVSEFPEQVFILDHCGKPEIRRGKPDEWKDKIRRLAAFPNVYCKLSGLFTEAPWKAWSAGDFYPYLDVVFENFTANRLLFGSDWPVMLLSGMYVQWKSLLEKYMQGMIPDDHEAVFGGNAVNVYRL